MGTAQIQGELWGARAEDWTQFQEPAWTPLFATALSHAGVGAGTRLLDIGCGAGGALAIARERGAEVAGIDGSEKLVAVARRRLPGARIEVGEMEELPFSDESFDVVIGINAFQFAGNLVQALAEARRACRRGGTVFMVMWAHPEDCQLTTVTMRHVMALLPPAPPGRTTRGSSTDPVTIDKALGEAGLQPVDTDEFAAELVFPDVSTAVRAVLSAGITVRAIRLAGEDIVARTIRDSLPSVTRPDGSVAWRNRFRRVTTRRP